MSTGWDSVVADAEPSKPQGAFAEAQAAKPAEEAPPVVEPTTFGPINPGVMTGGAPDPLTDPTRATSPASATAPSEASTRSTPVVEPEPAATPAATAAAEERGVDLADVEGTGKDGKVTKADVVAASPEAEVVEPEPVPVDTRQAWVCVTPEGPRTVHHGIPHALFHSDAHMFSPPEHVLCPTCGGMSVRKATAGEQ